MFVSRVPSQYKVVRCRASALHAPVGQRLDLVDAHEPVLRGVGLLQHVQVEVLVADLGAAHAVEAGRPACGTREQIELGVWF